MCQNPPLQHLWGRNFGSYCWRRLDDWTVGLFFFDPRFLFLLDRVKKQISTGPKKSFKKLKNVPKHRNYKSFSFRIHGSVKHGCIPNRIATFERSRHLPLNHGIRKKTWKFFLLFPFGSFSQNSFCKKGVLTSSLGVVYADIYIYIIFVFLGSRFFFFWMRSRPQGLFPAPKKASRWVFLKGTKQQKKRLD